MENRGLHPAYFIPDLAHLLPSKRLVSHLQARSSGSSEDWLQPSQLLVKPVASNKRAADFSAPHRAERSYSGGTAAELHGLPYNPQIFQNNFKQLELLKDGTGRLSTVF